MSNSYVSLIEMALSRCTLFTDIRMRYIPDAHMCILPAWYITQKYYPVYQYPSWIDLWIGILFSNLGPDPEYLRRDVYLVEDRRFNKSPRKLCICRRGHAEKKKKTPWGHQDGKSVCSSGRQQVSAA